MDLFLTLIQAKLQSCFQVQHSTTSKHNNCEVDLQLRRPADNRGMTMQMVTPSNLILLQTHVHRASDGNFQRFRRVQRRAPPWGQQKQNREHCLQTTMCLWVWVLNFYEGPLPSLKTATKSILHSSQMSQSKDQILFHTFRSTSFINFINKFYYFIIKFKLLKCYSALVLSHLTVTMTYRQQINSM